MLIARGRKELLGRLFMGDTTKAAIRNIIVRRTVIAVTAKRPIVIHKYFR